MDAPPPAFCPLPFRHLSVNVDGTASLCCRAAGRLQAEGRALTLNRDTFEELWNSDHLRRVREDMVAGRHVDACAGCDEVEAAGGMSLRQETLAGPPIGSGDGDDDFAVAQRVVLQRGSRAEPPSSLGLWLGNECNLKCRMCSPALSSTIASDPVHARWHGSGSPQFAGATSWASPHGMAREQVFAYAERLQALDFAGGEPLLSPALPDMLEWLVRQGHAPRIALTFNTNGTVFSPRLVRLLRQFKSASLQVSVDGVGPLQEYIRAPSQWEVVRRNVVAFAEEGLPIAIQPTPQAYNVFGLLELIHLCDELNLPFILTNVLRHPSYLSFDMLPRGIVDEARAEWEAYRAGARSARVRDQVDTLIAALQRPRPWHRPLLQAQFIRFTNDLDQSRGQSLRDANPRLHRRLVDEGFDFRGNYGFAAPPGTRRLVDAAIAASASHGWQLARTIAHTRLGAWTVARIQRRRR